jgi:hypothetical protein
MELTSSHLAGVSDGGAAGETEGLIGSLCVHHWVLEPVGLTPSGRCKLCGISRVFTNKLYEKPGDAGIRPTEKQRQAMNSDLKAREFIANGLVRQQRYD